MNHSVTTAGSVRPSRRRLVRAFANLPIGTKILTAVAFAAVVAVGVGVQGILVAEDAGGRLENVNENVGALNDIATITKDFREAIEEGVKSLGTSNPSDARQLVSRDSDVFTWRCCPRVS
jgi:hypothetical protein